MNHRIGNLFSTIIATTVVTAGFAIAEESQDQIERPAYSVIASNCSRSTRLVAARASISRACEEADKLRQTHNYAWIVTGKLDNPWLLHPRFDGVSAAKSCSVYRRYGELDWRLEATTGDVAAAEVLVKAIRDEEGAAEAIYHFAEE